MPLSYEKTFYQGLIQWAVALLHQQRGNTVGFQRLSQQAQTKLGGLAFLVSPQVVVFGVDLTPWLNRSPID